MTLLVRPAREHLPQYCAALERGWSPNNLRPEAAGEELTAIAEDPDGFLALMDDPKALGGDVTLPDGRKAKRIPGLRRFIWDNGFCGIISLRWQDGTSELPPHVPGHIGFAVVPWKRRRGYASRALGEILGEARARGLAFVDLTADIDNIASRKTIEKCGGDLVKTVLPQPGQRPCGPALYRIALR